MRGLKIVGLAMLGIVGLLIAVIALITLLFFINTEQQKRYIQTNYHPLLPSVLVYTGKVWTNGGIDIRANWTYSYTSSADRQTTYSELVDHLQSSGYQIATGSCPSDYYLTAVNKKAGLYLTVNLNPSDYGSEPTGKISSVTIETDKNNHDNVYIDPAALSCASRS